ncbi:MAG: WGR domain-containing protein [Paracoccaceae bacterium]
MQIRIRNLGIGVMHLVKTEQQGNMFRFYRMEIVRGLFGDWGLVRNWGRIGSSGQLRTDWFDSEGAAKDARFDLHMQKAKRGYE